MKKKLACIGELVLTQKLGYLCVFLLAILIILVCHNYFLPNQYPLTADAHGNLGVSWTFRNSILRNGYPSSWDFIGGTSLGEFHPFPGSFLLSGLLALVYPNQQFVLWMTLIPPIFFSGIFMYLFIKLFTGNNFGALLSALIYAFNPYFLLEVGVYGHINLTLVYMLLPLFMVSYYKALLSGSKKCLLFSSFVFSFIVLTDLQFAFFSVLLFVFISISLLILSIIDKKHFSINTERVIKYFLVIVVASFLLSFSQFVNWFTLKNEVVLKGFSQDEVALYSLSLNQVMGLLAELPSIYQFTPNPFHYWYVAVVGIGFLYAKNKFRYLMIFCLLILVLMSMGSKTPVFGFFQKYSQLFSYFRVPSRFLFPIVWIVCLFAGYITPSFCKFGAGKSKLIIIIGFILLLLGFVNPPMRWRFFQTFSLTKGNPNVGFIEQVSPYDYDLYQWIKNKGKDGRISFYKLHPGGVVLSMFWSTYHGRRTFDAAVSHVVSWRLSDFINLVNASSEPHVISNLTGILNIRYLIPRDFDDPLKSGEFEPYFKKIEISQNSTVFENTKILPFLRIVDNSVLVIGSSEKKVVESILSEGTFKPESTLIISSKKKYLENYTIDELKKYNYLVLAGNFFNDEQKAFFVLNNFKKTGSTVVCSDTDFSCKIPEKVSLQNNGAQLLEDNSKVPNDHYSFKIKVGQNGSWLVLSEPYSANWKTNLDGQISDTEIAYRVINASYIPGLQKEKAFADDKILQGSIYYGKNKSQEISWFVSFSVFIAMAASFVYWQFKV